MVLMPDHDFVAGGKPNFTMAVIQIMSMAITNTHTTHTHKIHKLQVCKMKLGHGVTL